MDRVIQDNQPLFVLVWVGSVVALVAAAVLSVLRLEGSGRLLLVAATLVYLLGVQLPTVAINIPMNNTVQTLDVGAMDEPARAAQRPLSATCTRGGGFAPEDFGPCPKSDDRDPEPADQGPTCAGGAVITDHQ